MTRQERIMLAALKGTIKGKLDLAKAHVRTACRMRDKEGSSFYKGYCQAAVKHSVEKLRDLRDVQRHIHEYCKGVGYHAQETPAP